MLRKSIRVRLAGCLAAILLTPVVTPAGGGVTEGALKLQYAGLIRYARGRITVLDRPGLEKRTCECYAVVKREYDRLLPDTPAT